MSTQWRKRAIIAVWTAIFVLIASVATIAATNQPRPDLEFQQSGHWVYNADEGAVFHVNGGTKQVDARTGAVRWVDDRTIVQGSQNVLAAGAEGVVVFGKSTLAVDGTVPTGTGEVPVGLEVVGGPYFVYRHAGRVVRFDKTPPTMINVGGPVIDPAVTTDGTVWMQRSDNASLCALDRRATATDCPSTAPANHVGTVAVAGNQAMFVDPTAGSVTALGRRGLGVAVDLGVRLSADAKTGTSAAGARLPIVDPRTRQLLLLDVSGVGAGRAPRPMITVPLGDGTFETPVGSDDVVVVLDSATNRLLTFDQTGKRKATVPVPEEVGRPKIARGQDGRVYVDGKSGKHTLVVDPDGSVTTVGIGKQEVPSPEVPNTPPQDPKPATPAPKPQPPTTVAASAPGAPTSVSAQPGNSAATVSWGAARANGSPVMAYRISWRTTGGGSDGSASVGGNQLSMPVTGLRNGATYVFTVVATNQVGSGPGADSPPVTPSSEVPGPPGNLSASVAADGTATLTWQTADGQGHQITGYSVTAQGTDGSSVSAGRSTSTGMTVPAGTLTLGTTYTFTAVSTNELGLSSSDSAPSNAVTPYKPADAPPGLSAAAADQTITLNWSAANLNGGGLVDYKVSANGVPSKTTTATSATFSGLSNGTAYTFSVHAETRQRGQGGPSTAGADATTTATPGRTPTVDVTSAGSSGDRQITLHVVVNDYRSGPVTCHVLFNGAERWTGGCGGSMDITVGGLSYATTYDITARGSNSFGAGPTGSHASARTNDPPPPPPSIGVSKGAPYSGSTCTDPSCARVHVALRNFAPNTTYTISCRTDYPGPTGEYYRYTARTNGSGALDSEVCFYGYPRHNVWANVNGIDSNHLTW